VLNSLHRGSLVKTTNEISNIGSQKTPRKGKSRESTTKGRKRGNSPRNPSRPTIIWDDRKVVTKSRKAPRPRGESVTSRDIMTVAPREVLITG